MGLYKIWNNDIDTGITLLGISGIGIGLGRKSTKTNQKLKEINNKIGECN